VAALAAPQTAVVGDFLTLPGAKASGMLGRPSMMLAVSKNTKSPQAAVRFVNFMLTDPEAARILGTTRGIPLAQSQIKALQQDGKIDAVPMQAFQQIAAMRNSGKLTPPSPLFENPRMARLVRDIFDQVAYDKISAEDAAKRLQDEGNAMLKRLRY
jgi:oligogalacturonide transport system substrate-binding protein